MANDEGRSPTSQEEKRLKAENDTLKNLISHLQRENTELRLRNDDLTERYKAIEQDKKTLQGQLSTANQKIDSMKGRDAAVVAQTPDQSVDSGEGITSPESETVVPTSTKPNAVTDQMFEEWLQRRRRPPPYLDSLRLHQGGNHARDVTLPRPQIENPSPSRISTPPSPVRGFTSVNGDQSNTGKTPIQNAPDKPLPTTAVVKCEENGTRLANIQPSKPVKRVRKGIMSSGVRAPKRKNPDKHTDNPPTPFAERRSKRARYPVNYDEEELENAGEMAEEAWREDSKARSSARQSAEDEDYETQHEPQSDDTNRSPAPSPDPTADAPGKTSRYKKRPGNEEERWAKGKTIDVNFRFTWKAKTVRDLYIEWYHGANDNPSIDSLEKAYGAGWRNHPEKRYNGYANDWVSKRRKIIKALDFFAEEQGKSAYDLAGEWDKVVQGRINQLGNLLPAPTRFEMMKRTMTDPLVHFSALPKKSTGGKEK